MKLTTNYNLKKPEGIDTVNIEDFNYNSDIIDNEFNVINTKLDEALQLGVNAKDNVVQAINSKKTVPNVTNENNWEFLSQSIRNIKEGSGNAVASDVLAGKTFTNNDGVEYTGTMVNRGGATTVTPKTSNQTKAAGYYSGAITIKGDSNLVASNILSGKSIFGVKGNVVAGKRWASGTTRSSSTRKSFNYAGTTGSTSFGYIEISLGFTPSIIRTYCWGGGPGSDEYVSIYSTGGATYGGKTVKLAGYGQGSVAITKYTYNFAVNSSVSLGSNKFHMPVGLMDTDIAWVAYE